MNKIVKYTHKMASHRGELREARVARGEEVRMLVENDYLEGMVKTKVR